MVGRLYDVKRGYPDGDSAEFTPKGRRAVRPGVRVPIVARMGVKASGAKGNRLVDCVK